MTIIITIVSILLIIVGFIMLYNWIISIMWASELGPTLSHWLLALLPFVVIASGIG